MASPFEIALTQIGVKEVHGIGNNPKILEYHATTTLKATSDLVAWCSSFVNWCVTKAGLIGTNSAAARSWLTWGVAVKYEDLQPGDIVVFSRGTNGISGHVAMLVTKPPALSPLLKCIGGNQHDEVCIEIFSRARVLGYRRPLQILPPLEVS